MTSTSTHSHPRPVEGPTPSRHERRRTRTTLRRRRALAIGAAALAVAGFAGAAVHHQRIDITLTDDGITHTVAAQRGRTVGEELRARGIALTGKDRVTPAANTAVTDGTTITVVRAKDVSVTVDGTKRGLEVAATTVSDAAHALGARPGALVQVSRGTTRTAVSPGDKLTDGASITIRNPQQITVTADGRTRTITTTAASLDAVLKDAGIARDSDDIVSRTPNRAGALPVTGDHVTLTRVATTTRTVTTALKAPTKTVEDASKPAGSSTVRTHGKDGRVVRTQRVVRHNGAVVSTTTIATTKTEPVATVIAKGTKKPVAPKAPARSTPARTTDAAPISRSSGLNWGALAMCESTGNPAAVSPGGTYRGLYQFTMTTWRSVGGVGDPAAASAAEQTKRAQILYDRAGAGQWPVCGRLL